jgi:uncharacterized membrane protein
MEYYFAYAFLQAVMMTMLYGQKAIKWNWTTPGQFFVVVFAFAPVATVFLITERHGRSK